MSRCIFVSSSFSRTSILSMPMDNPSALYKTLSSANGSNACMAHSLCHYYTINHPLHVDFIDFSALLNDKIRGLNLGLCRQSEPAAVSRFAFWQDMFFILFLQKQNPLLQQLLLLLPHPVPRTVSALRCRRHGSQPPLPQRAGLPALSSRLPRSVRTSYL